MATTTLQRKKKLSSIDKLLKCGAMLMKEQKHAKAIEVYKQAVKNHPNEAIVHYCLGVAFHQTNQIYEAIGAYSNALLINPKLSEAFENLAEAQNDLKFFEDALVSIQAAIKLNHNKASSYARLAQILTNLYQYHQAIDAITIAIKSEPKNPVFYFIRSYANKALNQLKESMDDLRTSIILDPSNSLYSYNLSFDLLLDGQFTEGWQQYESRFKTKSFLENTPKMASPLWNGEESLIGKTVLICPEQGLGDQIQFARYAFKLIERGAKVIMTVAPPLVSLMQEIHPDVFVTSSLQAASELPAHDFNIPLMSLMGIFNTTLNNIPSANRYIQPNEFISKKWANLIGENNKLQVGITWSGSQVHANDHNRSISLEKLRPLFKLNVDWHVLQTEIRTTDEAILRQAPFKDWRSELTSLHETAGLLDQLDLLITVDTSVAHLSAALGKATWIMLPYAPDFRWLLNRTDSPWYPSVKLFRQAAPRCWDDVIDQIYLTLTKA